MFEIIIVEIKEIKKKDGELLEALGDVGGSVFIMASTLRVM